MRKVVCAGWLAYRPVPVDRPADGAMLAESGGVPPTLAAAESVPRVLVGVLVCTSAWLPPQAGRTRALSSKAARGRRKCIRRLNSKPMASTADDGKAVD